MRRSSLSKELPKIKCLFENKKNSLRNINSREQKAGEDILLQRSTCFTAKYELFHYAPPYSKNITILVKQTKRTHFHQSINPFIEQKLKFYQNISILMGLNKFYNNLYLYNVYLKCYVLTSWMISDYEFMYTYSSCKYPSIKKQVARIYCKISTKSIGVILFDNIIAQYNIFHWNHSFTCQIFVHLLYAL